jgi:ATP-binding cassette subfamily B protein
MACTVVMAVIGLLKPLLIGDAIDALRQNINREAMLFYGLAIIGITLVQGVFRYGQRMILVTMSRRVETDLRDDFFTHLQTLDSGFYQRYTTGDLMARATNDLGAVRMLCGPAIMYSTNTLFSGAGALILMVSVHPKLSLVALTTLPLVAIFTHLFGQRIHHLFTQVQESFSAITTQVQENLSGVQVVRAYAREAREEERFSQYNENYVDHSRKLILWQAAFMPLIQTLVGLGFAGVLAYGGYLMLIGELTVGQFVTFHLFFSELIWPMIAIGWVVNLYQRGTASLARMQEILNYEPKIRDGESLEHPERLFGTIRFRNLSFAYEAEDSPVLNNLEFEVPAGQTVAIVGRTGSGKSTLLSLIPRMIDPSPGELLVDGIDVHRLPLETLRRAIAMVPQETFLFSATVAENIAFGHSEASPEEILKAADLAGLKTDLADFPDGIETLVGERGITLSGGQKQRVALARALLRSPRILLLDDCLSAVDTNTEKRILGNLRTVFPGRTVFFVTHRVSAARTADQIMVMDHGHLAEHGTHQELLDQGGHYANLHRRQRLEEELAAV